MHRDINTSLHRYKYVTKYRLMYRCRDATQFCNDLCIGHNVAMKRDTFFALWCSPIHVEPTSFAVFKLLFKNMIQIWMIIFYKLRRTGFKRVLLDTFLILIQNLGSGDFRVVYHEISKNHCIRLLFLNFTFIWLYIWFNINFI